MSRSHCVRSITLLAFLIVLGAWGCSNPGGSVTEYDVAPSGGRQMLMAESMAPSPSPMYRQDFNTEQYDRIDENGFRLVSNAPLSTFSVDVDTASYSNMRRFLEDGQLPPPDAVRIEELINYFSYDYPAPEGNDPFSVTAEVGPCPWNPEHRLVHIGLRGQAMDVENLPPSNLVFLLDVSGSMDEPDKLPLLTRALRLLVDQLDESDSVSIVVYAGASGVVLEPTRCDNEGRREIAEALDNLHAGGSTNGGEGIELAYRLAQENFVAGGVNRVILATDGDFNIGVTNRGDLTRLIEDKAGGGVFLTVLGFGTGNLQDATMEDLADRGNGNYAYIDTLTEARRVLVEGMGGTLVTIAKDVKIQVEFNPAEVQAYRLVGYENRLLNDEDFNDDTRDAGEIGAGHTVTALYEIVPQGVDFEGSDVDPLRYQQGDLSEAADSGELMTVKLRYKEPDGDTSSLISQAVSDSDTSLSATSLDFRFAAAVAELGMLLRNSEHLGQADFDALIELALSARGDDPYGRRAEFVQLARLARDLQSTEPRDTGI